MYPGSRDAATRRGIPPGSLRAQIRVDRKEINKYQMDALREARLVEDSVLDKAHPGLREHFRLEYQKGLDSILASYRVGDSAASGPPSGDQVDLQVAGVRLLKQWSNWMSAHHTEIRMPDQLVDKSK
jgi:hypothetical protein